MMMARYVVDDDDKVEGTGKRPHDNRRETAGYEHVADVAVALMDKQPPRRTKSLDPRLPALVPKPGSSATPAGRAAPKTKTGDAGDLSSEGVLILIIKDHSLRRVPPTAKLKT